MAERRGRGPAPFRQRDVTAAIKSARRAGAERFRVEIEQGKIIVVIGADMDRLNASEPLAEANEWDGADEAL